MKQHKMPNGKYINVPKGCKICLDRTIPDGKHFIWLINPDVPPEVRYRFSKDIENNCNTFEVDFNVSSEDCAGIVTKGE